MEISVGMDNKLGKCPALPPQRMAAGGPVFRLSFLLLAELTMFC